MGTSSFCKGLISILCLLVSARLQPLYDMWLGFISRAQVQNHSMYHCSLYPRIVSTREVYVLTSHADSPLCAWDLRWASCQRLMLLPDHMHTFQE